MTKERTVKDVIDWAIERAVDEALGEVARQQSGIMPPTGAEARNAGIDSGRIYTRLIDEVVLQRVARITDETP